MQHKTFGMRRALALATLLSLLVLAGCGGQTDPATNVTATSATLNGQKSCKVGESGTQWWRYRLGINPWQETTHANWSCSHDQSQSVSTTIAGLTPGSHYQYEICGTLASYPPVCANADGAADNAVRSHEPMDAFDTKDSTPASRSAATCALDMPGVSNLTYSNPNCRLLRNDTSSDPQTKNLWGLPEACMPGQIGNPQSGGDPSTMATGDPQGNASYRTLTVFDGDNISGERCELSYNTWHQPLASPSNWNGTFYDYTEGMRRATYLSYRFPENFQFNTNTWQNIFQMKQAGPADAGTNTPVIHFYAGTYGSSLTLAMTPQGGSDTNIWSSAPLHHNIWTRIAVDAFYSQNPSLGWIKVYVDANGDGDFADSGEQSPVVHGQTLLRQLTSGCSSSPCLNVGDSIPDHLRAGIYHDSAISCPNPSPGCSDQIDNVQVLGP
jgi:hypothetical protein